MSYEKFGFHSEYPPLTLEMLEEFEQRIGSCVPNDYREFLLQFNGGSFSTDVYFPLLDSDEVDDDEIGKVYSFFGLFDASDPFDLRNASKGYGFDVGVPANYIAIGHDFGINQICISISGDDNGWVYQWRPIEPWVDKSPTMLYLRPIAVSFRSFWGKLRSVAE